MTRTRIISEEDIIPRRAAGYRLVKGELKNQEWVSPSLNSMADGALYFTVEDLQKWDGALYTERLLKKASLERMWTVEKLNNGKPNKANYGFGWEIGSANGHRVIAHGGAWQGFTCYIARYVDDRLTIVALTNLDSGHANPKKIVTGVAAIYNPALKPAEEKPIGDKEPQVTLMVRRLLRDLADGKAKPEPFTQELENRLFPRDPRVWAGSEGAWRGEHAGIDGENRGERAEALPVPGGLFAKDDYAFDWADEE
jgi:Beta-lactamase